MDNILEGGGLAPQDVSVTQANTSFQKYGSPVKVGLRGLFPANVVLDGSSIRVANATDIGTSYFVYSPNMQSSSYCQDPNLSQSTSTGNPVITSVQFSTINANGGATLTISGSGFENSMPQLYDAAGGGYDSNDLVLSYQSINAGWWDNGNSPNSDGIDYISWSPTQIIVNYPGEWGPGGTSPVPLNGGSMTVGVYANSQEAQYTASIPQQQSASSISLSVSNNTPYTGNAVTLTATTNAATGSSKAISIVDTTTGDVLKSCTNASTCSFSPDVLTQTSPITQNFVANVGSANSTTGSLTSNSESVTWAPVDTSVSANEWWNAQTGQTIGSSGETLPQGTNDQIWWSINIGTSNYSGWSQNWDSPNTSGASFSPNSTIVGWLPTNGLGLGTHHIILTLFFSNGIQEIVSPPITIAQS